MNVTLDRNLFTQIGLDSGSLTMLGTVIHSFREPGEYRGVVRKGESHEAVFYISVDKDSAVAQANIDLAMLTKQPAFRKGDASTNCCSEDEPVNNRFTVNPRGFAVFHVSSGPGGFDVHVEKAGKEEEQRIFDSRTLQDGDLFSGALLRPGTYAIHNVVSKARGEVVVSYPEIGGKAPYRPGGPVRIQAVEERLEPARIQITPGQGLVFECRTASRIRIELLRPDDGPKGYQRPTTSRGWRKTTLPKKEAGEKAL
jgi:hypothetical protein